MTVQERLQLLNFGYTKEQVDAMDKPAVAQPVAQAPTVAQPAAQPVQTQAPTVAQPVAQAPASDFLTTLTALGAMLNAQNTQPVAQAPTVAQPVAQAPTVAQPVAQAPTVAQPVAQASAVAQPAPTQQPAQPVAPAPVQLTPDQLTKLIQGVAVQTASGTIETPPTAEQALLNMFSSVAGEVNKNEQN